MPPMDPLTTRAIEDYHRLLETDASHIAKGGSSYLRLLMSTLLVEAPRELTTRTCVDALRCHSGF